MRRTFKSQSHRSDGSCAPGYHSRKAYTVKRTGTRVESRCIRATTKTGPRAVFLKASRGHMTRRLRGIPKESRGPTTCPSGTIVRNPYVRIRMGQRQFVPASCITDVGNPGKGIPTGAPGIGVLRKGDLTRFGYDSVTSMSDGQRHLALAVAVKEYGSLTVWRKLNAVYIYTRHTAPASSAIFKADRDWIKEHYGIKAF